LFASPAIKASSALNWEVELLVPCPLVDGLVPDEPAGLAELTVGEPAVADPAPEDEAVPLDVVEVLGGGTVNVTVELSANVMVVDVEPFPSVVVCAVAPAFAEFSKPIRP
jgi:hypothetical protein